MYAKMDEDKTGSECAQGEPSEMDVDDGNDHDVPSKSDRKRRGADDDDDSDSGSSSTKRPKHDKGDEGISALESLNASETRARETMITRPFLLSGWVKLRAYQQIGLNWLVSLQTRYVHSKVLPAECCSFQFDLRLNLVTHTSGASMGSSRMKWGERLSVYLVNLLHERISSSLLSFSFSLGKTLQTISMVAYLASYKGIWGPHLIIVPTSCLVNWEVEFKRFCPGLKVLCYYGNAKRRKELRAGWTKSNVQHVVITSYQLAVQDAGTFKRRKWYYMILDEGASLLLLSYEYRPGAVVL